MYVYEIIFTQPEKKQVKKTNFRIKETLDTVLIFVLMFAGLSDSRRRSRRRTRVRLGR